MELTRGVCMMALTFFLCLTGYSQTSWSIGDSYSIEFSGKGAEGTFRGLEGVISFDPNDLTSSKFDMSVDPSTISTGNKTKDRHARGGAWFDVARYIIIKFQSEEITKSEEEFVSKGRLVMHGVARRAKIRFKFDQTSDSTAMFVGNMVVSREEHGIDGPLFSFMVGDEFEVDLNVPVIRQNP